MNRKTELQAIKELERLDVLLRRDAFGDLIGAEAVGQEINDETTELLRVLTSLKHLSLIFTQVTSRGVGQLSNLLDLDAIDLGGNIHVDDGGARAVAKLPGVSSLSLWDTTITDAGLKSITELPRVKYLYLSGTRITDRGLSYLRQMQRLKGLDVRATKITDHGLSYLKEIPNLEWLDLSVTDVSNQGLIHLETLSGLKRLHLKHTSVKPEAAAELQTKLPNCQIFFEV